MLNKISKAGLGMVVGLMTLVSLPANAATPSLDSILIPPSVLEWHHSKYIDPQQADLKKGYFKAFDEFFKKFDKDYKYNGNFPYLKDGVWVNRFYYDKYILKTSLRDVACANVMSYVGVELNEVDNKYKNEILSISNTFDDILAKGAIEDAIFKQLNSVLYTASGALKEKIKNGSEAELDKIYRDAIDAAFIAAEKNISEELKDAVNKTLWGYLKDHMKGLIVAAMRGKIDLEKANRVGFKVFIKSMITAYVQVTKLTYSVGAVWKTAAANWSYEKDKKLLDKLVDYHDSGCTTWDGTSFWDKTTGSIELQKYGFLHSWFDIGIKLEPRLLCFPSQTLFNNSTECNRVSRDYIVSGYHVVSTDFLDGVEYNYYRRIFLTPLTPPPTSPYQEIGIGLKNSNGHFDKRFVLRHAGHEENIAPTESGYYVDVYNNIGETLNLNSKKFAQDIDISLAADYAKQIINSKNYFLESSKAEKLQQVDQWLDHWKWKLNLDQDKSLKPESMASLLGRIADRGCQYSVELYPNIQIPDDIGGFFTSSDDHYVRKGACFFNNMSGRPLGSEEVGKYLRNKDGQYFYERTTYILNNNLPVNRLMFLYSLSQFKQGRLFK